MELCGALLSWLTLLAGTGRLSLGEIVFQGSHAINMDAKGRLAIPTKVRELLSAACEGRIVVTAHPEERCLLIYPEGAWAEKLPEIDKLPSFNKKAAKIKRLMMGNAAAMELDGNGRILLAEPLRKHACLEKKLFLVGSGASYELWGEEQWNSYLEDGDDDELPDDIKQSFSL